jgi:hypothetical protein
MNWNVLPNMLSPRSVLPTGTLRPSTCAIQGTLTSPFSLTRRSTFWAVDQRSPQARMQYFHASIWETFPLLKGHVDSQERMHQFPRQPLHSRMSPACRSHREQHCWSTGVRVGLWPDQPASREQDAHTKTGHHQHRRGVKGLPCIRLLMN